MTTGDESKSRAPSSLRHNNNAERVPYVIRSEVVKTSAGSGFQTQGPYPAAQAGVNSDRKTRSAHPVEVIGT